ncbi:hypothetical protein M409DRAFT_67515 [Zasmidium cellare ATCC 36951]|uniref:Cytochrome P450 n=1 Tax=Zasmidium cellare ATCC 36951 TaxID=1080233 RepID=A0A6A6CDX2_ZASCE|nr:uncharacterized protein M409DRAFT_67515 [Zasmidium cellare ATCC 36951]KAF2165281.1 hypothetical protein M409DRAFT_67515 [Zasmidium cellare ATCC 36951]
MALLKSVSGSIFVDILVLAVALFAFTSYRSYNRLKHIPGPPLWGWTVLPLFMVHLRGEIYDVFGDLNKKYGPLVRIAPNTLLVSDPEELRKMSAARSPYTRSPWYVAMRVIPGVENVLSTRDENDHDERRKKMASGYSGKENVSLERDIDECVLDLVSLIDSKYISSPPDNIKKMDLARKVQFFTSDIMSKLAFDDKFHDLRDDHDNHGYINEIETMFPNMFCVCTVPSLLYFLTNIGVAKLLAPSVKDSFGLGKILAITKKQVAKRFDSDGKPNTTRSDMLSSFLRHGLTQGEAEQEGVLQLAAGSDTTATGLRSTLLCIISNPRVSARLSAEIEDAVRSGKATSSKDGIITDEQARILPYLQACIKEGLRWFPPIAGMLAKYTPPEGDTICGFHVPGNVSIGYSASAVHHSPALFGPDEEAFRPERWLTPAQGGDEPSVEKIRAMEKNNELLFGYGKYQCLGKSVAAIELNKVVFEMMRRFDMTLKDLWVTARRREEIKG